MDDPKFLPTGWHWKITPDQIEKIKKRDRDTVNQVYFDNLDKFKMMAYRFCGIRRVYSIFQDCVQQIYVDMCDYDYTNRRTLFWSIRHSFYKCRYSRFDEVSLSTPIGGMDKLTIGDCLSYTDDSDEKNEHERHVLEVIAAQTALSNRNKDLLTAYAFDCLCYEGLFEYEYSKACSA